MERLQIPGAPAEILLRRSDRARRISLRVSRFDGRVLLSLPRGVPVGDGVEFVQSRSSWLRSVLATRALPRPVVAGATLPVEGRLLTIRTANIRGVRIDGDTLSVSGAGQGGAAAIAAWLKALARERLATACDRHAAALGVRYSRLALRDTRSRWGSCSAAGRLMFCWRLVMAPSEVLDYVAAHEVAHLLRMDHSPAFWRSVEQICPSWRQHRLWLRHHGSDLHLWQFGAGA